MKRDFKTIKNIILLIASALTLVAVTFSWFSLSKKVGNFTINENVSGTTISVKYNESTNEGKTYKTLNGDMSMSNMVEGKKAYYRMDVKTFKDTPVKLVMSFEGLKSTNPVAKYVYFDYKVCTSDGVELSSGTELNMSNYTNTNVFAVDVSSYQNSGKYDFTVYYDVYVKATDGEIPSGSSSLGEVKLLGQQIG